MVLMNIKVIHCLKLQNPRKNTKPKEKIPKRDTLQSLNALYKGTEMALYAFKNIKK